MKTLSRQEKIDKLKKFCPTHYCYWQNCGCKKPTEKKINRLRHSKI